MQINERYRSDIIVAYLIIFYILMIYKYINGMFLFQMQPAFFYTREDLFTWVFMLIGFHSWLLNNPSGWVLMDVLFYSAPIIFYFFYRKSLKNNAEYFNRYNIISWAGFVMLFINIVYIQCYTLYPTNSIEGHVAWMLFPIVFIAKDIIVFKLLLDGVRYFMLYFLVSAGFWKFVQGGIFNSQQMSAILLQQHTALLVVTPEHWYAHFIQFLINTPKLSYALYFVCAIFEISCILGYFTKKYDKFIVFAWLMFLFLDHLIMRITYYEISVLLIPFIINSRNVNYKIKLSLLVEKIFGFLGIFRK